MMLVFKWVYDSVDKDVAKERGWGAVWKASEQPFLDKLQGSLNQLRKIDLDKISDNKTNLTGMHC